MRTSDRRAFVLLAVLWVMVGMAAISLGLSLVARSAVRATANRDAAIRAQWMAEGCADMARAAFEDAVHSESDRAWSILDSVARVSPLVRPVEGRCAIRVRPVGSRLDVNAADTSTLRRLLTSLRIASPRADSLVAALADWRDADDDAAPLGAERSYYARSGRALPRNGPLADIRELSLVRGFDSLPGIDTLLDVERGRVVLDRASAPVLAALPGFGPEAVTRVMELRSRGVPVEDLRAFSALLSLSARDQLLARYSQLTGMLSPTPDAWIVHSVSSAGTPPVAVIVEDRLALAAHHVVLSRRRRWLR